MDGPKPLTLKQNLEMVRQLDFLRDVFQRQLPLRLVGGFADDALLHQKPTRHHQDVDFLASRRDSDLLKREFSSQGLKVEEVEIPLREQPYKLMISGENLKAEVVLYDHDHAGEPYIGLSNPMRNEKLKVYLDVEGLNAPVQRINDIEVRTVSPRALIRLKDQYHQAGAESNVGQVRVRNKLIDKFYPGENPESEKFKLRIERE